MSPEVYKNEPHTYAMDCWAVGCILFKMLTGNDAFIGNIIDIQFNTLNLNINWPKENESNLLC
jgi:serine/threonine protein kinase